MTWQEVQEHGPWLAAVLAAAAYGVWKLNVWQARTRARLRSWRAARRAEEAARPAGRFEQWARKRFAETRFAGQAPKLARMIEGRVNAFDAAFPLRKELRGWPKVLRLAPGHFIMRAPHLAPRRMQTYGGWKPPVLTGVALGFLNCVRFGLSAKAEDLA